MKHTLDNTKDDLDTKDTTFELDIHGVLGDRHFSFADLTRLTGVPPANINSLIKRGYFEPLNKRKVGASKRRVVRSAGEEVSRENATYLGGDVLRLHVIAFLLRHGCSDVLEKLLTELYRHLRAIQKLRGRWQTRTVYSRNLYPVHEQGFRKVDDDDEKEPLHTVILSSPKDPPRLVHPRNPWEEFRDGPWGYLTLDLHTLVETESERMYEFLRLIAVKGITRDEAARLSRINIRKGLRISKKDKPELYWWVAAERKEHPAVGLPGFMPPTNRQPNRRASRVGERGTQTR